MLHITSVTPLKRLRLRLTLSNEQIVERDLSDVVSSGLFDELRETTIFERAFVEGGTVVWPNGADIYPDVLIWGGPPPEDNNTPALTHLVVPRLTSSERTLSNRPSRG